MRQKKIYKALNASDTLKWIFAVVRFSAEQKKVKSLGHQSIHDTVKKLSPEIVITSAHNDTFNLQLKLIAREQYIFELFKGPPPSEKISYLEWSV
jgi:hypothetical protein